MSRTTHTNNNQNDSTAETKTGTIASLKNCINHNSQNHASPASQKVSPVLSVKYINPNIGESMIYIHILIARINNTQHRAINITAKNIVTIRLSQKSRTIATRLLTQFSADSFVFVVPSSFLVVQKFF